MNNTTAPLLLSLKPCYADMVFNGFKRAELRRRIASGIENRNVFVYASSPRQELLGGFRVGQVWKGPPDYIWQFVSKLVSMEKYEFDAYFVGCKIASALEITNTWEYDVPVPLEFLVRKFQQFVVPQSWRYLRCEEHEFLAEVASRAVHLSKTLVTNDAKTNVCSNGREQSDRIGQPTSSPPSGLNGAL